MIKEWSLYDKEMSTVNIGISACMSVMVWSLSAVSNFSTTTPTTDKQYCQDKKDW